MNADLLHHLIGLTLIFEAGLLVTGWLLLHWAIPFTIELRLYYQARLQNFFSVQDAASLLVGIDCSTIKRKYKQTHLLTHQRSSLATYKSNPDFCLIPNNKIEELLISTEDFITVFKHIYRTISPRRNRAIPLTTCFEKVIGMDPEPEMLAEAQRQAHKAGVTNIAWIEGGSADLEDIKDNYSTMVR